MWQSVKNDLLCKGAGKYDQCCGEITANQNQSRTDSDVRINRQGHSNKYEDCITGGQLVKYKYERYLKDPN